CHTGHREGDLGVVGQALPRSAGAEPDLHAARKSARAGRTGRAWQWCGRPAEGALMHALSRRITDVLALQPDAAAVEYRDQWSTWGQIAQIADRMASLGEIEVGMLLRNRTAHAAALLGVLLGGGTVVTINPSRGDDRSRADIDALNLAVVVGDPDDLASLV